jgi:hypothetical protein
VSTGSRHALVADGSGRGTSTLGEARAVQPIPSAHLYYMLIGAGPTMFVLAPERRRLSSVDPSDETVIEAHADAVCPLLFGTS